MIVKSCGPVGAPMVIVKECTGHTCHPQHHVLWYLFHQPTTTVSENMHDTRSRELEHLRDGNQYGEALVKLS